MTYYENHDQVYTVQLHSTGMNSVPKTILAMVVVIMFLAGMMVAPSYAGKGVIKTTGNPVPTMAIKGTGVPKNPYIVVAEKCPNGNLAPDNDLSKCPPLISHDVILENGR